MRRTRPTADRGFAIWAAMPLVAVLMFWLMRHSACAAPAHISSFAPQPVNAPPAPLQAVLPPSPPLGNSQTAALRVASRPVETRADTPASADATVAPDAGALTYMPTTAELTSQLLPAVQRGYALAQRGALYAAQTEFVQVLRRVAQAKDASQNSEERSRALAAGLRALDEAADFAPHGTQLEGEVNVWLVASSHRTPVLEFHNNHVSVHEASALYHAFAERQLAWAVAGEQAGSIALHGLGKINARLAELGDDDVQHVRSAMAMFSAALAARPDNHLAANELGVLLCKSGRPGEAARLFEQAIDFAPTATAYHNLAVAQHKLGMHGQSAANEQESQRLASLERSAGAVSRRVGVRWVDPDDMVRVAQPTPLAPRAVMAEAPRKSPWKKTLDAAKSLHLPRIDRANFGPRRSPDERVALPSVAPPSHSQPRLR